MFLKKLPIYLLVSLAITACDRNDYVTWHCKKDLSNSDEKPLTMILEGSSMKVHHLNYNFCGSLGPISYFDLNCSGKAELSAISFIPKTGAWTKENEILQCQAL